MFDTFILLTGPVEAAALSAVVRFRNPALDIVHIETLAQLAACDEALLARSRLIGFATGKIVPPHILDRLGYGAYNFHPGSPQYPGWAASSFAVYENAGSFGATAHVMVEKVDAGPIVGVELFAIPSNMPLLQVDELALILLARLFWNLSEALTTQPTPLRVLPIAWSGRKRTQRDYRDMCDVPVTLSKEELDRRIAAFGRGDYGCDLTVTLHGHKFRYSTPVDATPAPQITAQETPVYEPIAKRA